MDDKTRRRLAFLVACKAGLAPTSVYSFETGRHTNMEAGAQGMMIDHGSGTRFDHSFDYARDADWRLKLAGSEFTGFDHGFGHHFAGVITGRSVQIYDYGEGRYFDYSV